MKKSQFKHWYSYAFIAWIPCLIGGDLLILVTDHPPVNVIALAIYNLLMITAILAIRLVAKN